MKFDRRDQVEQTKAEVWQRYIQAGLDAKQEWLEGVREIEGYLRPKHSDLFTSDEMAGFLKVGGENGGLAVYENNVALVKSVLVPHLLAQHTKVEVTARGSDSVYQALAAVLENVIAYTHAEGKQNPEKRKAVTQGVVYGIGFMRPGWDPEREIHTSRYVSAVNVVIDPNARNMDEARWVAVGTQLALDELRTTYKGRLGRAGKWRLAGLDEPPRSSSGSELREWEERSPGIDRDQVMLWEVYSKMGNGLTRGPFAPEEFKNDEDSNLFVKLDLVQGHPWILEEGAWDLPLYLDRRWPLVAFVPSEGIDRLWPDGLIMQALVHQKACDVLGTLELNAARVHGRDVFTYRSDVLTPGQRDHLLSGAPSVAIGLSNMPPGASVGDVITRIPLGTQVAEVSRVRDRHEQRLEAITGVTPVLQGGAGQQPVERSATAAQQQMSASNMRLADMRSRVTEFDETLASAEAISIRLAGLVDATDVQAIIGDLPLGWRIDTEEGLPLRGPGSIEEVAPKAAAYFPGEDMARGLLMEVWVAIIQASAKRSWGKLVTRAMEEGVPLEQTPPWLVVRRVTAEDVFHDTAGLSPRDLMRELQYTLASGTSPKQDPEAKRAYADRLLQTVLPVALRSGDYAAVNAILARADDAFDIPVSERMPPLQPPPPPPPAPGAPPGGGAQGPGEGGG